MNSEKRNKSDDETSRNPEESSSSNHQNQENSLPSTTTTEINSLEQEEVKKSTITLSLPSSSSQFQSSSSNSATTSDTDTETSPPTPVGLGIVKDQNHSIIINQTAHNSKENNLKDNDTSSSNITVTDINLLSESNNPIITSPTVVENLNSAASAAGETDEMKRAAAKKLIERYFYQLLGGCGNPKCNNKYCASSGEVEKMTPNQAAARAIQLFSQDAKLCDAQPSKIPRTTDMNCDESNSNSSSNFSRTPSNSKSNDIATSSAGLESNQEIKDNSTIAGNDRLSNSDDLPATPSSSQQQETDENQTISATNSQKFDHNSPVPAFTHLDEEKILELIDCCEREKCHSKMVRTIGEVFSSFELLSQSFVRQPSATIDEMLKKAPKDLKSIKKEDLRTLEGDLDKDEDCSADKEEKLEPHHTTVDLPSLRRAMQKLFQYDYVYESLNNGLHSLSIILSVDLRLATEKERIEKNIHILVMVFEIMAMSPSEFLELALPYICRAAAKLPVWAQARLARIWAEHCKSSLRSLLETLQQLISLQVITGNYLVHDNEVIINTTKILKILYYANILAGELESPKLREDDTLETSSISEDDSIFNYSSKQTKNPSLEDKLSTELGISVLDCWKPFLPFEEFYNEPLSDAIDMDYDFLYYKNLTYSTPRIEQKFSFMLYSFILTPATKVIGLYYDSRIRMYRERRSMIWAQSAGQSRNPYLKLKVRRNQIIEDALIELEMIAMSNPKDLKKQLVVEFIGEQGIDEGGLSKEFFQLIVEEIFNPDYGMFIYQEDTKTVWFNSTSFENEAQFTLIGIVLSLAIYNNIILAVNFPMVVYRKLMGLKGSFNDLADWNPVLYRSLESMLNYEGNDMEEVFMQTFKINYKDVFGNILEYELKPNGDEIFVNQENKHEFVELYSDFLLNTSIKKQFKAFKNGFQMVTDESPLQLLFRPEEIELLVCGSNKFDFIELEKSTEYEGGYTDKSQIIIDFWNIVHGLPLELKRKLLEFTTGSDRVPVGGLSRLKLVIARNGPDSDRLPTSHTCFNVLLLPEYSSKEKLEDRLLKAINYSKGFGML